MRVRTLSVVLFGFALACASPKTTDEPTAKATTFTQAVSTGKLAPKQDLAKPLGVAEETGNCREELRALLSAPHDPPSKQDVDAICSQPVIALAHIAENPSEIMLRRLRATGLLGAHDTPAAQRVLINQAQRGKLASLRRTAVQALGKHRLRSTPRDAALRKALEDPDAHVRAEAIRNIQAAPSTLNRKALTQARNRETVPFVRVLLDSAWR